MLKHINIVVLYMLTDCVLCVHFPRLIYKCSMCDTVFTLQSLLNSHFDQHVGSHKVSVFKCPDCSSLYAQKQLLLDHIKVHLVDSHIPFSYSSTIMKINDVCMYILLYIIL